MNSSPARMPGYALGATIILSYLAAARLGNLVIDPQTHLLPVWPLTGLALGWRLRFGWRRTVTPLLVAAFLDVAIFDVLTHRPFNYGIWLGNSVAPFVSASLMERFADGRRFLDRPANLLRFCLLGAASGGLISALGGLSGSLLGPWKYPLPFWEMLPLWSAANGIGALLIVPPLLLWTAGSIRGPGGWRLLLDREVAALVIAGFLVTQLAFGGWPFPPTHYPLGYLCVLPLLWAALRFPGRGVTAVVLGVSTLALVNTTRGHGLFAPYPQTPSLLQLYLGTLCVLALVTAAVVRETRTQRAALHAQGEDLRLALEATRTGTWDLDLTTGQVACSPEHKRIFDSPVEPQGDSYARWLERIHPEDRAIVGAEPLAAFHGENAMQIEFRTIHRDASVHWVHCNGRVFRDARGGIKRVLGFVRDITGRKEAEITLATTAERLRLAMETTQSGAWDHDKIGGDIVWSPEHNAIFGFPPEQRVGNFQQWLDRVHPDDRERTLATAENAIAQRQDFVQEFRAVRPDGSVRWVQNSARAFYDAAGQPTRVVGVVRDVTERKQTEEALRASEAAAAATAERLRLALMSGRAGTWDWDLTTDEVLWSPEYKRIFGLPPERTAGRLEEIRPLIHPEDRAMVRDTAWAAIRNRTDYQFEFRVLHPDGMLLWVAASGVACYDADGKPFRVIGVVRDITERKVAEEALRESEQRFRLASLHSPFPIMLFADDGEVLQVNEAWLRLSGYTREELATMQAGIARTLPDVEPDETFRQLVGQLSTQRGAISEDLARRFRCKDGTERVWDMSTVNLGLLPDGHYLRIVSAVDVTTRQRDETALRQAKEEAERANRAKSEFLSRMSHELRTPLNAILGFGQVLEMSALEEPAPLAAEHILRAGRHLLSLVDEVLDLSRVEAGELSLRLEPLPFGRIVSECISFVARLTEASGIVCTMQAAPSFQVAVRADERRLRQVVLNLLSNAIKYNHPGGRVTLHCEPVPEGRMRLSVEDTGSGISPEGLARLFVPFERLGQEMGEVEGTGLGLVVSRQLVEAMSGSLGVTSQPGEGSTFWVELPAAVGTADPSRTPPDALATSPAPGENSTNSPTVLCVEDNVSNQQVLQTMIKRLRPSWRLLLANDGVSGLEQAHAHRPDIILLDLQLPGKKGDVVLRELREAEDTRTIPVLVLSADATESSRERLLALGATDYLPKPFNVGGLLAKVDGLMQGRSSES